MVNFIINILKINSQKNEFQVITVHTIDVLHHKIGKNYHKNKK